MTSAKEHFNNQVDRMTHSMDTNQTMFLVNLSLSSGLMNKVDMGNEKSYAWAQ